MTAQDLRDGLENPTRWLTYGGDYANHRHSPLTQITPRERAAADRAVGVPDRHARQVRSRAAGARRRHLHHRTARHRVGDRRAHRPADLALPPRSARTVSIACCGLVNRGFGVLGDRLFKTTLDAHVVAISRKTGALVWDTAMDELSATATAATTAPLVVKDKVIVGVAGAEYGVRGFIDAYDAQSGKQVWRFYTTAGPDDPGHDDMARDRREGVAARRRIDLGARRATIPSSTSSTGAPATPGPITAAPSAKATTSTPRRSSRSTPTRASCAGTISSRRTTSGTTTRRRCRCSPISRSAASRAKVVLFANRNGFFYVLDRATGKLISGKPFIETTWAKEIRPDGRPMLLPNTVPSEEGTKVCPDQAGGDELDAAVASIRRCGLFFVTARESCGMFFSWKDDYNAGRRVSRRRGPAPWRHVQYSALRAIDVTTGERRWEFPYASAVMGRRAVDRVRAWCSPARSGNLMAFDAKSGKNLWHFQTGSSLYAGAITYMLDGRQHVLMPVGHDADRVRAAAGVTLATTEDTEDTEGSRILSSESSVSSVVGGAFVVGELPMHDAMTIYFNGEKNAGLFIAVLGFAVAVAALVLFRARRIVARSR